MAEVKIKIVSEFDPKGTNAAKAAFGSVDQTTGKSAKDSAGVFTQDAKSKQDYADTAQAMSDMTREAKTLGNEQAEAAKKTSLWGATKRDLLNSLKALKHEIPGLGLVINALKNPYVAIAAAVAAFIAKVTEQIAVQNELARQSAQLSAALDPVVIKTVTHKLRAAEAAASAREHAAAMAQAAQDADSLEARLNKVNQAIDRELKLRQAAGEVEKAQALAGVVDPVERARIGEQFEARKRQEQQQAEDRKANLLLAADRKARQDAEAARQALPGAQAEQAAFKEEVDQRNAMREKLKADLAKLQNELGISEEQAAINASLPNAGLQQGAFKGRPAAEIRADILSSKNTLDSLSAGSTTDAAGLTAWDRYIRQLQDTEKSGGRFSTQAREAVANSETGRQLNQFADQGGNARIAEVIAHTAEQSAKEQAALLKQIGAAIQRGDNERSKAYQELLQKLANQQGK